MRKHRTLVRATLALAAAAAVGVVAVGAASARQSSGALTGQGSTFVAPLVNTWIPKVKANLGITVTYPASPGGSGAGVSAITAKQVSYGTSDAPLSAFATTCHTCVQIPWALSGTSIIYNLGSVKGLKITGAVLAKIYLGQITFWDNSQIKVLNPGKNLPHRTIITVHRDSSSGTTYNFTDYLSSASSSFKSAIGVSTFPSWPGGTAAHGSSGVATTVANNFGAIGYVDVYYGVANKLSFMAIKNKAGQWVLPTLSTIAAAATYDTHPSADGSVSIVNPPNNTKYNNAYPIATYTYVDVQAHSGSQTSRLKSFLTWAVTKGQSYASADIFAPLPSNVRTFDKGQIATKVHV